MRETRAVRFMLLVVFNVPTSAPPCARMPSTKLTASRALCVCCLCAARRFAHASLLQLALSHRRRVGHRLQHPIRSRDRLGVVLEQQSLAAARARISCVVHACMQAKASMRAGVCLSEDIAVRRLLDEYTKGVGGRAVHSRAVNKSKRE
eukprot:5194495-Pleurochrysis_carterae.AAC.6